MGGKSKQSSNSSQSSQGVSSGVNMNYGMNQSGQQSSSSGSSVNSSSQDVWGGQQDALANVYDSAGNQYGQAIDQINGMQPQVQDQVSGAFNQAQGGYGNQLGGGFASGLQGQVGPNAYTDALAGDMMSDAAKLKQQNLGGLDARAAAAGMSGSSGYRDQATQMAENVDEQTMQGLNQLRFNSQNQGIQNQMNLAGMQDRNQQGAMANMGAMQQGAMNQFNPAMAGLNATGAYGQIIGGPTTLSQSNQSSNGFSNGMNMGLNMGGNVNTGGGVNSSGDGALGGLHAGYRYDFGGIVAGVELSHDWTDISLAGTTDIDVDSVTRLMGTVGYASGANLFYGALGVARADADAGAGGETLDGTVIGVGMAHLLNPNTTLGVEILSHEFDADDLNAGTDAEATTIQAKVAFKF